MAEALGGRLPLLHPAEMDEGQRTLYDHIAATAVPWAEAAGFRIETAEGRLIGPFNAVLFSPDIGRSFLDLQDEEGKRTALSERVRQVVILTVGSVWQAPYELYAHSAVARRAGLSEEAVRALAGGEPADDLSHEERVAQRFTRQLASERRVDDETYRAAESAFGRKGLVDMVVLSGCYHVVCSMLNAFGIPAPPGDAPRQEDLRGRTP